jgi:hypothetical protein
MKDVNRTIVQALTDLSAAKRRRAARRNQVGEVMSRAKAQGRLIWDDLVSAGLDPRSAAFSVAFQRLMQERVPELSAMDQDGLDTGWGNF